MLVLCTSSFLFFKALFLLNVISFAQKFYEMGKLRLRELERICPKSPNKKTCEQWVKQQGCDESQSPYKIPHSFTLHESFRQNDKIKSNNKKSQTDYVIAPILQNKKLRLKGQAMMNVGTAVTSGSSCDSEADHKQHSPLQSGVS